MTTSEQDQNEHESPGPRRPIDELTADELLAAAKAEARAGELSDLARTTRTVYLGACLLAIRDRGLYAAQGAATFKDFAASLKLEKDRCARLLQAGQVPLALVKDRHITECKLAAIGTAPAWLWPALCAEVTPAVGMRTVRRAVSVAKAEVAAKGSEADAIALAIDVLRDPRTPESEPTTRGQHGHRACLALRRVCDELAQAAARPESPHASTWAERSVDLLGEVSKRLAALGVKVVLLPDAPPVVDERRETFAPQATELEAAPMRELFAPPLLEPEPELQRETFTPQARTPEPLPEGQAPRETFTPGPEPMPEAQAPRETFTPPALELNPEPPPALENPLPENPPENPAKNPAAHIAPSIIPGEPGYDVDLHLAYLERPCPLIFEGQEYSYAKLGAAIAVQLDHDDRRKLNEAFMMLVVDANRDDLIWKGEARVRSYGSLADDPELPRGLVEHWINLCIQPKLDDRFPYAMRSLCEFKIADYRRAVMKLEVHKFDAPYGTFFRDMAERVPYAEFLEWFKHSPADWERYRVERNRLEYGGARCADAINGAMDIVRALRKAEGRG